MEHLPGGVQRVFRTLDVEAFPFRANLPSRLLLYPVADRTLPADLARAVITSGFEPECLFVVEGADTVEIVSMVDYAAYAARARDAAGLVQGLAAVDGSWGVVFSEEFVGLLAGRRGFVEQLLEYIAPSSRSAARDELLRDVEEAARHGIKLMNIDPILRHVDGAQHRS